MMIKVLMTKSRKPIWATIVGICAVVFLSMAQAQEFHYNDDDGPGFWWELDPGWGACAGTGANARQSPVDISNTRVDPRLKKLDLQIFSTTLDIFNNGHTTGTI